jgi:hypothetical protein
MLRCTQPHPVPAHVRQSIEDIDTGAGLHLGYEAFQDYCVVAKLDGSRGISTLQMAARHLSFDLAGMSSVMDSV